MPFDAHFIQNTVPGVSILYGICPVNVNFSVDSRTIQKGDIFVALSGERVDGHSHVISALKNGAAGAIIAAGKEHEILSLKDKKIWQNAFIVTAPDPLQALLQLAYAWRTFFDYPILAITGSVGKTSTKELIAHIVRLSGKTYFASQGNQNTILGVALNILRMKNVHEGAIFEVGVNKRGEMEKIAALLRPTYAIVTNVGHAHMEGLGSLQDISFEKRSLFSHFSEKSIGIVNGDQSLLSQVSYKHPILKFGSKTINQIQARKIVITSSHINFVLKIYQQKYPIKINNLHAGVIFNSLAAVAATYLLGIPLASILQGIQEPVVVAQRFEACTLTDSKGILIDDCYNANPESMKAALLAFQKIKTEMPKIAILGDMLELGADSSFWHRQLGRFLNKVPSLKKVILVGDLVKWTKKTAPNFLPVELVSSWQDAADLFEAYRSTDVVVLVKGSNGVGLTNLVKKFVTK